MPDIDRWFRLHDIEPTAVSLVGAICLLIAIRALITRLDPSFRRSLTLAIGGCAVWLAYAAYGDGTLRSAYDWFQEEMRLAAMM